MFKFAPYILKTLWGHRGRTLLTVLGTAVAMFVFCFVSSVQSGLDDLLSRREAEQVLIAFQANKFCPFTSHLREDYAEKIAKLDGVREVVPIQVFTNNCRASLDVVVFYGVPPQKLRGVRDFNLTQGSWEEFERNTETAIVGRAVAERRKSKGLQVGKSHTVGSLSPTIVGIFESDNPAEENYIYTHLSYIQRRQAEDGTSDLQGTVTQFEIHLQPGLDSKKVADLCEQIDAMSKGWPELTDTRPKGVFQQKSLGDLTELIRLLFYLGIACVGLVIVLVATTTFMAVQDRVQEHAILQTIGFSGFRIFRLVLVESVLLSLAGGILGGGSALAILAWKKMAVGAEAVTIAFLPSYGLAGTALVVALVTGVLAGMVPAWTAARAEIVPSLRQA
ncbi:MAG: ABC transporter permease [Planctomycetia bacterium]|nr:ABC transporter permease [Planctomycetia bacterium]